MLPVHNISTLCMWAVGFSLVHLNNGAASFSFLPCCSLQLLRVCFNAGKALSILLTSPLQLLLKLGLKLLHSVPAQRQNESHCEGVLAMSSAAIEVLI